MGERVFEDGAEVPAEAIAVIEPAYELLTQGYDIPAEVQARIAWYMELAAAYAAKSRLVWSFYNEPGLSNQVRNDIEISAKKLFDMATTNSNAAEAIFRSYIRRQKIKSVVSKLSLGVLFRSNQNAAAQAFPLPVEDGGLAGSQGPDFPAEFDAP